MNATRGADPQELQAELASLREAQSRLFSDLAASAQRYRALARSVLTLQEDERRRFARDLHDGLGQQITAILHQLEPLAQDPALPGQASARARRALDLCSRALHDARNLARLMRPTILDDLGLVAALHWLARTVSEGAGIDIDVECEDEAGACGAELSTLVFRFVQEALNNVAKHSAAQRALVVVGVRDGQLSIVVADDGRGFDATLASRGGGSGLGGLRERVGLFGGRFTCTSSPADGTQLRAVVPLEGSGARRVSGHVIRVVLADDHTLLRDGLAALLAADDAVRVVAQTADGPGTVATVAQLQPDVLVLDLSMPGLGGIEVLRRVQKESPRTRTLVLTMHEEQEYVLHAVQAGAHGFLLKDSAARELLVAVRDLGAGRRHFGSHAADVLARQVERPGVPIDDPYRNLTVREREVFHLIIEGATTKEVARKLDISPRTAENHRTRLLDKLELRNTAELIRYAARHRLLR